MADTNWTFGTQGSGNYFTISFNGTALTVNMIEGSMDVNALWFSDRDSRREGSYSVSRGDSALKMPERIGGREYEICWDDTVKLSSTGLGTAGVNKATFLTAGESYTLSPQQMAQLTGSWRPASLDWSKIAVGVVSSNVNGGGNRPVYSIDTAGSYDGTAPVFTSGATASVDENVAAATAVYTAAANDASAVTYSLQAGGDASAFTIDAATGVVSIVASPDFEAKSSYGFTVIATDASGNQATKAVTLNVNDLDDTAPVFTSAATASVDENVAAATAVYTAAANDASAVTYSLQAGGDAAAFTIDAATGVVSIVASPDFETKSSYGFTVVATDASGNEATQAVTLSVNDLNEQPAPTRIFVSGQSLQSLGDLPYAFFDTDGDGLADQSEAEDLQNNLAIFGDQGNVDFSAGKVIVEFLGFPGFFNSPVDLTGFGADDEVVINLKPQLGDWTTTTIRGVPVKDAVVFGYSAVTQGDFLGFDAYASRLTMTRSYRGGPGYGNKYFRLDTPSGQVGVTIFNANTWSNSLRATISGPFGATAGGGARTVSTGVIFATWDKTQTTFGADQMSVIWPDLAISLGG
jgi:Cadherin domain